MPSADGADHQPRAARRRGETTLLVPPLSIPAPNATGADEVLCSDAGRLFEVRARQVRPDFKVVEDNAEAVADICRRLDGIPLALELAAARTRVLSPAQIAAGLSDRFEMLTVGVRDASPRHQTLRASVDWSYDLLEPAERLALGRLSVFVGAFDLDAAQAVVGGDGIASGEVLDLVTALVDQSLLHVSERDGRAVYRLLETLRVYATERLVDQGDQVEARDRHLDHYLALAERSRDGLAGPRAGAWTSHLHASLDDLRAAMDWASASDRPMLVLAIAEPTFRFWFDLGLYPEMHRRLIDAIDGPSLVDADRVRGFVTAALLAVGGCEWSDAWTLTGRALASPRSATQSATGALALVLRAYSGLMTGYLDGDQIWAAVEESLDMAAHVEDEASRAHVMLFAGNLSLYGRSLADGSRILEEVIELCEVAGVTFHLPAAHAALGLWPVFSGDVARAQAHARRGLDRTQQVERHGWAANALTGLAVAALVQGDRTAVEDNLAEAGEIVRSHGLERTVYGVARERWLCVVAYRFGDATAARAHAESLRHTATESASRLDRAWAELVLGGVDLLEQRIEGAHEHVQRAYELSATPRYPYVYGRALLARADLARLGDDLDQAGHLAHEGLDVLVASGDQVGVADALDAIARVAGAGGRPKLALRLMGATDGFRSERNLQPFPLECERLAGSLDDLRALASNGDAATWRAEGSGLDLQEAVDYARRGRGERLRPPIGWTSLTPVEIDTVRLVAEGLTNSEIGDRLFISVNTVKKHLSHIYAKVGIQGRSELVAEAIRRDR